MAPRVLMVDDEVSLLDGLRRVLRGRFDVDTATSGPEGLAALEAAQAAGLPYEVVVSDMRMPEMNGAVFLARFRERDPECVRLILSGQADLASTVDAVNDAGLFRFLTKPCESRDLIRALDDAVAQYRLIRSERELLERTLPATVDLLTDILATAVPVAYMRTTRLAALTDAAAKSLNIEDWRLPIAVRLSHLGCLGLPAELLQALETGQDLTDEQTQLYLAHPAAGQAMLERIPRLEDIATWVGNQPLQSPSAPAPPTAPATAPGHPATSAPHGEPAPARELFHAAVRLLSVADRTHSPSAALAELRKTSPYPRPVLDALVTGIAALRPTVTRREVTVSELTAGMLLEQDVVSGTGTVLVRKGERLSHTLAQRLKAFSETIGVGEPIKVVIGSE